MDAANVVARHLKASEEGFPLTVGQEVALVIMGSDHKVEEVRSIGEVVRKRGQKVTMDEGPGAMWFYAATGWSDSKNYKSFQLMPLTPELRAKAR